MSLVNYVFMTLVIFMSLLAHAEDEAISRTITFDQCADNLVCSGLSIVGEEQSSFCLPMFNLFTNASEPQLVSYPPVIDTLLFVRRSNYISNSSSNLQKIKSSSSCNGTTQQLDGSLRIKSVDSAAFVSVVGSHRGNLNVLRTYSNSPTELVIDLSVPIVPYSSDFASGLIPVFLLKVALRISCRFRNVLIERVIALEAPISLESSKQMDIAPLAIATSTTAAGGALSIVGGMAVPVAAMQQGATMALVRMSGCGEDTLNGEELEVLMHPLQFGLGDGVGTYARGAILGNLVIIPIFWGLLSYFAIPRLISLVTGKSLDDSRSFFGWPSCFLIPYCIIAEGSAMASVALITTGEALNIFLGIFGLIELFVSLGVWLHMLRAKLPISRMSLKRIERKGFQWMLETRWEWGAQLLHVSRKVVHEKCLKKRINHIR